MQRVRKTAGVVALFVLATGCARYNTIPAPEAVKLKPNDYPTSYLFKAGFEETWNATLDAIAPYAVVMVEKDSGIIVTDWVEGASLDYVYSFRDPGPPYCWTEELIAAEYRHMDGQPLKARYRFSVRLHARGGETLVRIHNREVVVKEKYATPSWPRNRYVANWLGAFSLYPAQKTREEISLESSSIRERLLLHEIGRILDIEIEKPALPVYDEDYYFFRQEETPE